MELLKLETIMDTLDLIEAGKFLKMHPEEVRKRVKQDYCREQKLAVLGCF